MGKYFKSFVLVVLCMGLILGEVSVVLGQKTTITFWHTQTGLTGNAVEHVVAKFNETHPSINVSVVRVPAVNVADISKLIAAIAAGVGPDVYYIDRFTVSQRAYEGILEPLEPYFKEIGWEHPEKEYFDFVWSECVWDDRVYAVPADSDLRAFFYRKDHFREVGLDPNKPPRSIDELDAFAEKLTKFDDKGRLLRMGFVPWAAQGSVYTWSLIYGAEWYDPETKKLIINSPQMIEALEWFRKYIDKYPGLLEFTAGFGSEAADPFVMGKLSMQVNGDSQVAFIRKFGPEVEYGVGPIPNPEGIVKPGSGTWVGGYALAIPKGSEHPKEALEFVRYYCGPEGALSFATEAARIPPSLEAYEAFKRQPPSPKDIYEILLDIFPKGTVRPPLPIWGLMWPEQHAVRDYVIYGQKTPKQALDDLVATCQPELDKVFSKK